MVFKGQLVKEVIMFLDPRMAIVPAATAWKNGSYANSRANNQGLVYGLVGTAMTGRAIFKDMVFLLLLL